MAQSAKDKALIQKVAVYVEDYMSHYDPSHDYQHILRVLGLTQQILAASAPDLYDPLTVTLAALLHDVGDKKYLLPGQDASTLVKEVLLRLGADADLATKVQTIATNVSYSSEVKNPGKVLEVAERYPELRVVQDADRLDAIGAVGIARCFTFGGAVAGKSMAAAAAANGGNGDGKEKTGSGTGRSLGETMEHFHEKLVKLEGMMKTEPGRKMARERTARLTEFMGWWDAESKVVSDGRAVLS